MEPLPKQLTLASFFSILWRQRYFMAAIVVISVAIGFVAYKRAKPVWESSQQLIIREGYATAENGGNDSNRANLPGSPMDLQTQIQVLQSGALLHDLYVAAKLQPPADYMTEAERESLPAIKVEQVPTTQVL